jgi:AraC-like DNA-binding protein
MDVLSDLIANIRVSSSVFLDARLSAPWCIEAEITPDDCKPFGSIPNGIVAYHYVVRGSLYLYRGAKDPPVKLTSGDIVLLPKNDRHILASAKGLRPARIDHLIEPADITRPAVLNIGGGGESCHIICGFLGCDVPNNPLLNALPTLLKLSVDSIDSELWIGKLFLHAALEFANGGIGSASILSKLAELLFVEALRQYLIMLPVSEQGWLAGLRDVKIGKALAQIHRQPAYQWSAEELARTADLSRSAFAERFTLLVGMPPMRYLGQWRLQLAAIRLRESPLSISKIAYEVGYDSESAFNRAFRKTFHCTPGQWRRSGHQTFKHNSS